MIIARLTIAIQVFVRDKIQPDPVGQGNIDSSITLVLGLGIIFPARLRIKKNTVLSFCFRIQPHSAVIPLGGIPVPGLFQGSSGICSDKAGRFYEIIVFTSPA